MSSQRPLRSKPFAPSEAPVSSGRSRATRSQSTEISANRPNERNLRRSVRSSSADIPENAENVRVKKGGKPNAHQMSQQDLVTLSEEPLVEECNMHQTLSPRRTSNISGTTVRTSNSAQDLVDVDPEDILDNLPDLYEASCNLLDLCCPSQASQSGIKKLLQSLEDSSRRPRKNLEKSKKKFRAALSAFTTERYISLSFVLRKLLGSKQLEGLNNGIWRPDDLFYQANLASTIESLVSYDPSTAASSSPLEKLDRDFPERFLGSFRGPSQIVSPGSSLLSSQSFEVGLDLRTQFTIWTLISCSGNPSFDPDEVIKQSFKDPDSLDSRGWHVEGLHYDQLSESQKQAVQNRCEVISDRFRSQPVSTALQQLQTQFPYAEFVIRFITWTSARKNEITERLKNLDTGQGIGLGIQGALESEMTRRRNSLVDDDKNLPQAIEINFQPPSDVLLSESSAQVSSRISSPTAPNPYKFNKPEMIKYFYSRKAQGQSPSSTLRNTHKFSVENTIVAGSPGPAISRSSLKTPLVPTEPSNPSPLRSNVPAKSPSPPPGYQPLRVSEPAEEALNSPDPDAGLTPFDIEDETGHTTIDSSTLGLSAEQQREGSQPGPSTHAPSAEQRAKMIKAQHKIEAEQDKENDPSMAQRSRGPKGKLNELQPDAEHLEFDSQVDEGADQASSEGRRPRETSKSSEDQEFESDTRKSRRKRKAAIGAAASAHKRPRTVSLSSATPTPPSPSQTSRGEAPSMSQMYHTTNQQAKATTSRFNRTKPVQSRRPWSAEEIERLIELIEENGISWAKIKAIDNQHGGVMTRRDQVALKDKARNMKVDYLKGNRLLPENFNLIPLNQKQKDSLRDVGIDYE